MSTEQHDQHQPELEQWAKKMKRLFDETDIPSDLRERPLSEQTAFMARRAREFGCALPESLEPMVLGFVRHGDGGQDPCVLPEWFDIAKFRKGQEFGRKNFFGLSTIIIAGLLLIYTFYEALKPIIYTGNSNTAVAALKRYTSTLRRVNWWYLDDPWKKGTKAYQNMQSVRTQHMRIRRILEKKTAEEVNEATKIPNTNSPLRQLLLADFRDAIPERDLRERPYVLFYENGKEVVHVSQSDMAITQFIFIGMALVYPKEFGLGSATEEELEAFCHTWKGLGYFLGIEDEFNFCSGTLDEVRQRTRDLIEVWMKPNLRDITDEWEHVGRAICDGLSIYMPLARFDALLLFVMEVIGVPMHRLRASLSYTSFFVYQIYRTVAHIFRLPFMVLLANRVLDILMTRALNADAPRPQKTLRELASKSAPVIPTPS